MDSKYKILLLDEHPESSKKTKEILESIGLNHIQPDFNTVFENKTNTQSDYDLCLLDYRFGKKNGIIHSDIPKLNFPDLPVILLAGRH